MRLAARELLKTQSRMALPNGVLLVVQGCGALGLNVAGEMLRRGCRVRLCDNRPDITRIRFAELTTRLRALCEEGLLLQGDIEYLLSRCSVAESMVDAVEADCTCLVIVEAVPDQVALKNAVFSAAAAACAAKSIDPAKVLFCSNSLNLSVASATATMPPEYAARVVGVRFMHPVWFVDEVEVTVADEEDHAPRVHKLTSQSPELSSVPQPQLPTDSTVATQHEARNFLASIGMKPFLISIDATSTRRRLTSEQSLLYMVRQKTQCARARAGHSPFSHSPGDRPARSALWD